MSYIKGFLATMGLIFLQIAILVAGISLGSWLTVQFGNLVWFFITLFATIIISWAVYGGFIIGVIRND